MAEIRVSFLNGPEKGRIEVAEAFPVLIGRSPECSVRVDPDATVASAKHVEVRQLEEGKYEVVDLSKNGVIVNGKPIEGTVPFPNHATIELGQGGPRLRIDVDENAGGGLSFAKKRDSKANLQQQALLLKRTDEYPVFTDLATTTGKKRGCTGTVLLVASAIAGGAWAILS